MMPEKEYPVVRTFDPIMYDTKASTAGFALNFLSLLGGILVARMILRLYNLEQYIYLYILFMIIFFNHGYIYDFSAMFLFNAYIYALLRKSNLIIPIFALAVLNKETALTLIGLSYLFNRHVAAHILVYIAIQLILRYTYIDAAGMSIMENHIPEHITTLSAGFFIKLAFLTFIFRPQSSGIMARFSWMPSVFFVLYILGGCPTEIRVFLDIYTIIFIMGIKTGEQYVRLQRFSFARD